VEASKTEIKSGDRPGGLKLALDVLLPDAHTDQILWKRQKSPIAHKKSPKIENFRFRTFLPPERLISANRPVEVFWFLGLGASPLAIGFALTRETDFRESALL
jgi:hypothetical protein